MQRCFGEGAKGLENISPSANRGPSKDIARPLMLRMKKWTEGERKSLQGKEVIGGAWLFELIFRFFRSRRMN
jgi:hypothetical protein